MAGSLFVPFSLNEEGGRKAGRIQQIFEGLLKEVESIIADGSDPTLINTRELALVRTKLQEASFFAVRSVAMVPSNQKD